MTTSKRGAILLAAVLLAAIGCRSGQKSAKGEESPMAKKLAEYSTVRLTADLSKLTPSQKEMLPLLIDAAKQMDDVFWIEAYGDRDALLSSISDPDMRRFAEINYGPWDRLDGDAPFVPGVGPKPLGANFYPADMTKEEFEKACSESEDRASRLRGLYTLVRRDDDGKLTAEPYSVAFAPQHGVAQEKLLAAAQLAEDPGLKRYLELRAEALGNDDYTPSDLAWLDMKTNTLDIVIGPIETYEDRLFNYKAAHEAYVLIKDLDWSGRLARYTEFLPELQRGLPVPDAYKPADIGTDSDLNAYDVVYYAGDCNAGAKTIAINLPNDEEVQKQKGSRRLQLENAMRAKFDRILVPIANLLIAEDQRGQIKFDAFFENIMFHEVAHGLGIKNTIDGKGTVRAALKDQSGALEEAKADVLGLYMVTRLQESGELGKEDVRDNYVTYLAGIFRSIRFGASDAHGRSNLAQFDFFKERGAFSRDEATGTYRVDFDRMRDAVDALAAKILTIQGDGDYDAAVAFLPEGGVTDAALSGDLARVAGADIPKDIVFEQGMAVLNPGS